ncbi:MAG: FecR family protein [Planctomycetaceae bacterium]|nr:FecR family protein [Planctomycetaceae bacterium]
MNSTTTRFAALGTTLAFLVLLAVLAPGRAGAAEYWVAATDVAVVTNNDCGAVSFIQGQPAIRRSFHAEDDPGLAANIADRVNSGDEIIVPFGSRLEMTSGTNIVLVFGAGTRVRMGGLRSFTDTEDNQVARLDLEVLEGEMRLQVRLHEDKPMAALIALDGAEVLVRRGDVELAMQGGYQVSVLSGTATARLRRGGVAGAPFVIGEGRLVGTRGDEPLAENELLAIRGRVPFSFETRSAALPPLPHMSTILEAP